MAIAKKVAFVLACFVAGRFLALWAMAKQEEANVAKAHHALQIKARGECVKRCHPLREAYDWHASRCYCDHTRRAP